MKQRKHRPESQHLAIDAETSEVSRRGPDRHPNPYHQLVEKAATEHRLMTAFWELTYRCTERCVHCYLDVVPAGATAPGELSTEECYAVLDQLAGENCLTITFSGGECLLRHDFFDIAAYARQLRFAVRLFTNAITVTDRIAARLADLPPTVVEVSIYGADAETHDRVTLVPGSFDRTVQGVRALRAHGVRVRLKTPLMRHNIRQFYDIRALAESLDAAWKYDSIITTRVNGHPAPLRHRPRDEDLLWLFRQELDAGVYLNRPPAGDARFCSIARHSVTINPYGDVFPCAEVRIRAGNLRQQPLGTIWRESPVWEQFNPLGVVDRLPVCATCELRRFCHRCHGIALNEDNDPLGCVAEHHRQARLRRQVLQERGVI